MSQKRKKTLLSWTVLILSLSLVLAAAGCGTKGEGGDPADPNRVTGITVTNGTEISLEMGKAHKIAYTVQPETVVNKGVTFTSSLPGVVKVSRNTGEAEALDRGTATITLKSNANPEITASVKVTVTDLAVAEKNKFKAEINPAVYPVGEVTADPAILPAETRVVVYLKGGKTDEVFTGELDSKGAFRFDMGAKAVTAAGVYDVSVAFPDHADAAPIAVKFHDVAVQDYVIAAEGWENGSDGKLESDHTIALKGDQNWGHIFKEYTVNLTGRRYLTVKAASVDEKWSIKIVSPLITGNSANEISVGEWEGSKTKQYTLDLASVKEFKGQEGDFEIVLKLYTIGERENNPKVVIDSVMLHGGLKAEIAAVAPKNYKPVTQIGEIADQKLSIGTDVTMEPALTPTDASFRTLIWTTSDPAVVTVNGLGTLHPLKAGDATITVGTLDGKVTKTFEVNVRKAVTDLRLQKTSATVGLEGGKTFDLGALVGVLPADATIRDVTYAVKSGAEFIETVSKEGIVTMKAEGAVVITVTTVDGGKTADFTLNIKPSVVMPEGLEIESPEGGDTVFYYSLTKMKARFANVPSDPSITWSTTTPTILRINAKDGNVRALQCGVGVIVATSNADPTLTAEFRLTVAASYAYAFDPASYDLLKLSFEKTKEGSGGTLQTGDKVKLTAAMAGQQTKTMTKTAGGFNPSLMMISIRELGLELAGTYSFAVEVTRDGKALNGYVFGGASLLCEGTDFLSVPNSGWTLQDANFSIADGVASLAKVPTSPGWGNARTKITFNLQKYPYLLFDVAEMPSENMAFDVKLSTRDADQQGLFSGITSTGTYLYDLSKSTNSLLKDKKGDVDLLFHLFYVGSNANPIKFSQIRFLSPETKAVSEATAPVLPTSFAMEQTVATLNALDAEGNQLALKVKSFVPEQVTFTGMTYTSADPTIAAVDVNGVVTAKKMGTTTITVTSIADTTVKQAVSVTVEETPVSYALNADLSTHRELTVALFGVADGAELTLHLVGISPVSGRAAGGKVAFALPDSLAAGSKEYAFTVTGGATGKAYATQTVFSYDLGKGAVSDANHEIALIGDGSIPNMELTYENGAYYNSGNGWGNVALKVKQFDADAYTYFELQIRGTTGAAGVKMNITKGDNTMVLENAVAQASGARTVRIEMSAFADKVQSETALFFKTLIVGNGAADKAMLGSFSAYHVVDAARAEA